MTSQEILTKAIEKSIVGGFDEFLGQSMLQLLPTVFSADEPTRMQMTRGFIFNHDFAKALWGVEPHRTIGELGKYQTIKEILCYLNNWQYHLQWMAVADDPLKYLGENI